MPTFLTQAGEPIWYKKMDEPGVVGNVRFQGGDYALVGEDAVLQRITEEEFLEMTRDMEQLGR